MAVIYNRENFLWNNRVVGFTDSAKNHLEEFKLDVYEIIDMLRHSFDCPEQRRHRRTEIEKCSNKRGKIFRIILFDDFCYVYNEECWCVKHVEPI